MLKLNIPKIKKEMKRQGLSVKILSGKMGISRNAIYELFKRKPISQADRFAEELGVDAKDLIINE